MWDTLGLPRETNVRGQSWNPNGISTFFHQLRFQEYIYWDAIYWRTGFLDRNYGEARLPFVERFDSQFEVETLEDRDERARVLTEISDQRSLWFRCARSFGMRDHMIIAFETSRTRPIESVDYDRKHELRRKYFSSDPEESYQARMELVTWSAGNDRVSVADVEAVLGRPRYELALYPFDDATRREIDSSVAAAVGDIIDEAVRLMKTLHVRPYAFWTSESELMIAAARPGVDSGPWTRRELEIRAPLIVSDENGVVRNVRYNLREWSNQIRVSYEPGYDWGDVREADANLVRLLETNTSYREFLESEGFTDDDKELIHRLVRLSRFGYCFASRMKMPS